MSRTATRQRRIAELRTMSLINTRMMAAVSLVFAGPLGGSTSALAAGDAPTVTSPPTPSDFEKESLRKEYRGLTDAEAERALEVQQLSSKLQTELSTSLGEGFGGLWIDPKNPGRIIVRVVREGSATRADAAASRVQSLSNRLGVGRETTVVQGATPAASLTALQASLDQGLTSVNIGAPDTVDAEPDVVRGTVQLTLPPTPSSSQRAFVEKALAAYPGVTSVGQKPGPAKNVACSGPWCSPPLRGGVGLVYGNTHDCTSGLVVRSLSDNVRYLSTAGHCFGEYSDRTGTWRSAFANLTSHNIGARHNDGYYGNSGFDFGFMRVDNPGGWNPSGYIRIQSDESYAISSWGASTVGSRVCMAGSYTNSHCGTVTNGLATRGNRTHTYRANFCVYEGDSGSPVFSANRAYGIAIFYYDPNHCDSVYSSVSFFPELNVAPVTVS